MNGHRAKAIRRAVYGDDIAHRSRQYAVTRANQHTVFNRPDSLRWTYQAAKRAHKRAA